MAKCGERAGRLLVLLICGFGLLAPCAYLRAQDSAPATATKSVGTIKSITGQMITLATDAGGEVTVLVQDGARLLRVEPGQKDLKDAAVLDLRDLQPGDRILVRGKTAPDGKSLLATSLIAMKKLDIVQKKARERDEWQKHGVGGLVSAVVPASGTITITMTAFGRQQNSRYPQFKRYGLAPLRSHFRPI